MEFSTFLSIKSESVLLFDFVRITSQMNRRELILKSKSGEKKLKSRIENEWELNYICIIASSYKAIVIQSMEKMRIEMMGINRVVDFFFSYFRKKKLKFKMQQLLHMLRMAFKVDFLVINFTRETFFFSNK